MMSAVLTSHVASYRVAATRPDRDGTTVTA